jgi:hypothetical protein
MRRGRILSGLVAILAIISAASVVPSAFADGGTPMDICQDLQDGHLDGTYTPAQLSAFFSDPTVQGYCGPITVVVPPPTGQTPPPTAPPVQATPQPVVVTAVKAARVARSTPTAQVKGAQHTVTAPPQRSVAPATAVRRSGTLPFTGMQLSLFLLVGLGLVGAGIALRATGKRRSES